MSETITDPSNPNHLYKIILIGDEGTGKSNLEERLQKNGKWYSNMEPTIGVDLMTRILKVSDRPLNLQFWDIASDKRFQPLWKNCFRNASAVFLVYDITNRNSFLHIFDWLEEFRGLYEHEVQIVLIGNKCDLEDEREVSYEEARLLAEKEGWRFAEVSARTLENVNYLLRLIATDLLNRYVEDEEVKPSKEKVEDGRE